MRNTNIFSPIADLFSHVGVAGNGVLRAVLDDMQAVIREMARRLGMYASPSLAGLLRIKHLAVGMWSMGSSAVWTGNFGTADQGRFQFLTATTSAGYLPTTGLKGTSTANGKLARNGQPIHCDPRTRLS